MTVRCDESALVARPQQRERLAYAQQIQDGALGTDHRYDTLDRPEAVLSFRGIELSVI